MAFNRLIWTLRKHFWKALLLVAVGIAAGYGFSRIPPAAFAKAPIFAKLPPPSGYESSVSLILNAGDFQGGVPYVLGAIARPGTTPALTTLASTYGAYLKSETFAQQLLATLHLNGDPVVVSKAISTRLVPNTDVLLLTVRWTSPAESQRLAETAASLFINGQGTLAQSGASTTRSGLLTALQAQADAYQRQIATLQQQIAGINQNPGLSAADRSAQTASLQQQLIGTQGNYSSVLNALANDGAGLGTDLKPARVLDAALPGQKTPKTWLNMVLGALAGMALGIGLMVLLEYLEGTVDSPSDFEAVIAAPVLGTVGYVRKARLVLPGRRGADGGVDPVMVTLRHPTGGTSEAFRLVWTMLQLGKSGSTPRSLLVTSAESGEGKTTVAANLAVATAQRGKTVILVDADLRQPSIHRLFRVPNELGLTNLLSSDDSQALPTASRVLRSVPDVPNLWLLLTGPTTPGQDYLTSDRAIQILEILPRLVDIVIYDAGPASTVADTLALAAQVDGVVVVARCMRTRADALQHLSDRLHRIGAHVLGGVLNAVPGDGLKRYAGANYGQMPSLTSTTHVALPDRSAAVAERA